MAIYLHRRKEIDSSVLARLCFERVICMWVVRDNIVSHRGTQFTRRFYTWVCSHWNTDHLLSTAFHPQMQGQRQRQNQTMEQKLKAFWNFQQDNWVELLPLAELSYNYAIHASTKMTPFWTNYHYHLVMQFKAPKKPSTLNSEIHADIFAPGLEETHQTLCKYLQEAQSNQTKYAGSKEVVFEVGDKVWLSTRHFQTT